MRILSGVSILLMAVFAACGPSKEKIMVWSSLRPVERTLLDSLLQEFGRSHPAYDFRQLFYAPEEARVNFIIAALAGKGPALLHSANDNIGPFVELDIIHPLEDKFKQEFLDGFLQQPVQANSRFKGHLWQIADRVGNHLGLVYNKALLKKPPQTINELIALKESFEGTRVQYVLAWNYTEPFFAVPFIGGYGGWVFDENFNPTLNTEPVRKAAQLIYDLVNRYKVIPKECDYEIANALFKDGLTPMIINGPWSWGTYLAAGIDIGLARVPKIDETGLWPTPLVSPMGYTVNKNLKDDKLRVTIELIKWLTSVENQLRFTRLAGTIPSRIDAYANELVQGDSLLQNAIDQLMVGKPMPVVTKMRWIWDAMRPAYQGIFTGQVTAAQAAEQMQVLAEKLIRENTE